MNRLLHYFAVFIAFFSFLVVANGAWVTSTGAGLSIPDWPLSYGQFFPPMVGGIVYQQSHRLASTALCLMTVGLAVWIWFSFSMRRLRGLALVAVVVMVSQALLGGIGVWMRLPIEVVIAHACIGQVFFCLMVVLATLSSPLWNLPAHPLAAEPERWLSVSTLSCLTSIGYFGELLLGAVVRHKGAGLAIPDFPTVFGGFFPPEPTPLVVVHFAHRLGAYVTATLVFILAARVMKDQSSHAGLVVLSVTLTGLTVSEVLLGAAAIWWKCPASVTSAHLAVGGLSLATSVLLSVRVFHLSAARPAWSPPDCSPFLDTRALREHPDFTRS